MLYTNFGFTIGCLGGMHAQLGTEWDVRRRPHAGADNDALDVRVHVGVRARCGRPRCASIPTRPLPPALPQGLVFRGSAPYYGCDVVVERHGDDVFLSIGELVDGKPIWRFPLRCVGDDPDEPMFVYGTRGENAVGPSPVRLRRGPETFDTLIDDWLDQKRDDESGSGVGVIPTD